MADGSGSDKYVSPPPGGGNGAVKNAALIVPTVKTGFALDSGSFSEIGVCVCFWGTGVTSCTHVV